MGRMGGFQSPKAGPSPAGSTALASLKLFKSTRVPNKGGYNAYGKYRRLKEREIEDGREMSEAMQVSTIGRSLASQANETGSTPVSCTGNSTSGGLPKQHTSVA